MTKQEAIDLRNARPFITFYLDPNVNIEYIVSIPKKATKKQIKQILRDAAAASGVRL